jgi:hypothetical protein
VEKEVKFMSSENNNEIPYDVLIADPVLWGQAILLNRDGTPRQYWKHQIDDLRCQSNNIIHLDGRDAGKSYNLTTDALHFATTNYGGQGLIATPHQGHLDSLIEEMDFQIDTSQQMRALVAVNKFGKLKIQRKPYYRIEFITGSILYFRPAGVYGDSFRSLRHGKHCDNV